MAAALETAEWVGVRIAGEVGPLRCKVTGVRAHRNLLLLALSAGVSRDLVGRMRLAEVLVPEEAVAPADESAWSLDDIEGFEVVDAASGPVGRVAGGFETPANLVLEVIAPDGSDVLLPAVEACIERVDLTARAIHVRDVEAFAAPQDASGEAPRAD
jgi:ribosomal 30S subunit maturation factor RimM